MTAKYSMQATSIHFSPGAAAIVTPLTFRSCQQVGRRELGVQMTGGRAERLHWNENGTAWTAWRQNVSRGSRVQRIQAGDAIQMPLFRLQLKCSFLESACRSLVVSEGEGGRYKTAVFFPSCDLQASALPRQWQMGMCGYQQRPSSCTDTPCKVQQCHAPFSDSAAV